MHDQHPSINDFSNLSPSRNEAVLLVLREARRLHRAVVSGSPAAALPVLRRLMNTATLRDIALPELYVERDLVRRKHVLRMLAVEVGYASWEDYRIALADMQATDLQHYDVLRQHIGYPNRWFSTVAAARSEADKHGGRVYAVGNHAVVVAQLPMPG